MSARINRHIFEQTRFDSGNLAQLGFVVHQYCKSGRYKVDVFRHDSLRTSFYIDVDSECKEKQISIDLAKIDASTQHKAKKDCCCEEQTNHFTVDKEGYALFYVGSGSGGFRIKSYPTQTKDESLLFDSTKLNKGDLYGLTLLRPGDYSLKETSNKLEGKIEVTAVKPEKTKYIPPEALHLDMEKITKSKNTFSTRQAQGIVFRAQHDDRIIVELNDSCSDKKHNEPTKGKVARWTNPKAKRA